MRTTAMEILGVDAIDAVADAGYYSEADLVAAHRQRMVARGAERMRQRAGLV